MNIGPTTAAAATIQLTEMQNSRATLATHCKTREANYKVSLYAAAAFAAIAGIALIIANSTITATALVGATTPIFAIAAAAGIIALGCLFLCDRINKELQRDDLTKQELNEKISQLAIRVETLRTEEAETARLAAEAAQRAENEQQQQRQEGNKRQKISIHPVDTNTSLSNTVTPEAKPSLGKKILDLILNFPEEEGDE